MTKLLQFYSNYLAATREEPGSINCPTQTNDYASQWVAEVSNHYNLSTLSRMLASSESRTRRAAAWALQHHGDPSHVNELGYLLSDKEYFTRRAADNARKTIKLRSQSPLQFQIVQQIEQCLSNGQFERAESLSTLLIEEAEARSDIYSLRAFVRFANGKIEKAASDCKQAIQLDRFAYQSFVALGQCYWHQMNDGAARECYLEAARIYPDWRPAHMAMLHISDRH